MGNLLKKISGFVYSHNRLIIIFFALVTVLSVITVFKMEIGRNKM